MHLLRDRQVSISSSCFLYLCLLAFEKEIGRMMFFMKRHENEDGDEDEDEDEDEEGAQRPEEGHRIVFTPDELREFSMVAAQDLLFPPDLLDDPDIPPLIIPLGASPSCSQSFDSLLAPVGLDGLECNGGPPTFPSFESLFLQTEELDIGSISITGPSSSSCFSSSFSDSSFHPLASAPTSSFLHDGQKRHPLQQHEAPQGQRYSCSLPKRVITNEQISYWLGTLPKKSRGSEGAKSKRRVRRGRVGVCSFCHETQSPEWRKGPEGPGTLCNACGLRWVKFNQAEKQGQPKSVTH